MVACCNHVSEYIAGVMHFLVFLWIPSYYNENYGVDVKQSALLSIFPWCCAIVATMTGGAIADALSTREVLPLTHVRKIMQGIGSFGPAGCLFYLAWLNKVRLCVCRASLTDVTCDCLHMWCQVSCALIDASVTLLSCLARLYSRVRPHFPPNYAYSSGRSDRSL
jgi:hypothetical protein